MSSWKNIVVSVATLIALILFVTESPLGMDAPTGLAGVVLVIAATLWITEVVPLFVTSLVVLLMSLVWLRPVLAQSGRAVEPFKARSSGESGAGLMRTESSHAEAGSGTGGAKNVFLLKRNMAPSEPG